MDIVVVTTGETDSMESERDGDVKRVTGGWRETKGESGEGEVPRYG